MGRGAKMASLLSTVGVKSGPQELKMIQNADRLYKPLRFTRVQSNPKRLSLSRKNDELL